MSNLETTEDLVQYVEAGMREKTDGTSVFRPAILGLLNRTYRSIVAGGTSELNTALNRVGKRAEEPVVFDWARSKFPYAFNFQAPENTGTLTATNNSTSLTFSAGPTPDLTDWYIRINNEDEIYRISAHTAGNTSATIDAAFVGAGGSGLTFSAFKLVYDISPSDGIIIPVGPIQVYASGGDKQIEIIDDRARMQTDHLIAVRMGMPDKASIVKRTDTSISLLFNGYPETIERAEMSYVPPALALSIGGNYPLIPKDKRVILAHLTLYYMLERVDDNRAVNHLNIAGGLWDALVNASHGPTKASNPDYGKVFANRMNARRQRIKKTRTGFEFN